MRQKIVVALVLGFVVIAALVFVLYQQQESQPIETDYEPDIERFPFDEEELLPVGPDSILAECGSQQTQYKKDLCWRFEAYEELNAGKCMNIEARPDRIDCIRAIARDFESPETTARIADCETRFEADISKLYQCLDELEARIKTEKLAVCNRYLSDDEPQLYMCHSEIARDLMDYSICEAMPLRPNDYRAHCISIVDLGP